MWIEDYIEPPDVVYRWANVTVLDSQGTPVDGAKIKALTASNATAYYLTASGVSAAPPSPVLDYLGRDASDFNVTDPFGKAKIPLLTDIITDKTLPLGQNINGYNLIVTYSGVVKNFSKSTSATYAAFPELKTQADEVTVALDGLVLEKPDLIPSNIGNVPTPIYHNETNAVLNVTVRNQGYTAAQNILVQFQDYYSDLNTLVTIKNVTVPSLLPGQSVNVSTPWYTSTEAGTHDITVIVDPENRISESNDGNNSITSSIEILPLLPDLSVANNEIFFSGPAKTGDPLTISANVRNTDGRASAVDASATFYLGKPEAGVVIGTQLISVGPGAQTEAAISWVPSTVGQFSIYVVVGGVVEYDYGNNEAYRNISVDVGGDVWRISGNDTFYVMSNLTISKNVVVEDNASLVLNAILFIYQGQSANQYWLEIMDNASVSMDMNGTVQSNGALNIYMVDNATLTIDNGGLSPINPIVIIIDGQSEVFITDSIITYDFIAPSSSEGKLTALNVNFTRSWSYFGGQAQADLTSVAIPELVASEGAVIRHYRWINVVAYDVTERNRLAGVYVQLDQLGATSPPYSLYGAGMTNDNGSILFKALCDEITADAPQKYFGNYRVNGTYWLNPTQSYSSEDLNQYSISLPFYSPPLTMEDIEVALIIPLSLPNLAIEPDGVVVDPIEVVTNSTSSITATVWNYGNVDAQNINVSFFLNSTAGKVLIGFEMIGEIPVLQYAKVSIPWTPNRPGQANILVVVDPAGLINETTKINNLAYLPLTVLDVPRLYSNSLVFQKVDGGQTVTQVLVGTQILLKANVKNIGQSTAHNFEVVYRIDNATNGAEIDRVFVETLAPNEIKTVSGLWQVTSDPALGLFQNRTIYVSFSAFTKVTDVPSSQTLYIVDDRPEMRVTEVQIWKGNKPVDRASLGERVFINFTVANLGMNDASGAKVSLSMVDPALKIYNTTFDLMAGDDKTFNISWVVNGVGIAPNNLSVMVSFVDEANPGNNEMQTTLDVVLLVDPRFVINLGSDSVKPGSSLQVFGNVLSADGIPLANTTMQLYYADEVGTPISNPVPVTTDSTGFYTGSITVPNEASGDLFVTLKIDNGGQPVYGRQSIDLLSDENAIPWWMILAIIAIIAIVIIVFVWYLYRHSLGKMVECGECGSLIPEDSKRCPKCGVVFETGTAKCSECGAWIPANVSECPECHAKFLTEPNQEEQGDAYMKAMQEQYDEYVNTYRDQAKAALGVKYSEEKFQEWLKTEPGFLTFEAWLAKREEDKKSGAFACPTCGILNPRGSTVCHKCGSVFANAPQAEVKEQPRTFRRIVKRSDKTPKDEPKIEEKK